MPFLILYKKVRHVMVEAMEVSAYLASAVIMVEIQEVHWFVREHCIPVKKELY